MPPSRVSREAAAPSRGAISLLAMVAACFGIRLLATLKPGNWVWGLDTLHAWPIPLAGALAAIGALGFIPRVADDVERALERFGESWHRRGIGADMAFAAAVSLALFLLRDPIRFVGDFDLRAGTLGVNLPPGRMFPQAFPLDLLVNVSLARTLIPWAGSPANAMQAVGASMALAFLVAGLDLIRSAGARGAALPAAAVLLLGGGWLVHFAGYDKFGPLMVGMTLAAAGVVRLARHGSGEWVMAAGAVICVLSHRAGYVVLPAVAAAFALAWRPASDTGRRAPLAFAAAAVAVASLALLARAWGLVTGFDAGAHLASLGGMTAEMLRAGDAINVLFLLAPLWPAGLLAAWQAGPARPAFRFPLAPVVVVALTSQAALLLATRTLQGNARDWDVFAPAALVFGLVSTCGFVRRWSVGARPAALTPVLTVTIATAIAFWGVHVSRPIQHRLIDTRLAASPAWPDAQRARAFDFLGLQAFNAGRYEDATRHFRQAIVVAPNPRYRYQESLSQLKSGHLAAARDAARAAIERAPDKGDPWWVLATIALAERDSAAAFAMIDSARARGSMRPPAGL